MGAGVGCATPRPICATSCTACCLAEAVGGRAGRWDRVDSVGRTATGVHTSSCGLANVPSLTAAAGEWAHWMKARIDMNS